MPENVAKFISLPGGHPEVAWEYFLFQSIKLEINELYNYLLSLVEVEIFLEIADSCILYQSVCYGSTNKTQNLRFSKSQHTIASYKT